MRFGRYYEEFGLGAVYRHAPGKTVTEHDNHQFCQLTMNHHPLHLDASYAVRTTQFRRDFVVGSYVYALLLGMSVPDISGKAVANLEVQPLRHLAPVFHGDTVHGESTVLDKTESRRGKDHGAVTVETRGYNQDGTLVCVYGRRIIVPRRTLTGRPATEPGEAA
ncbi:MaoC family dehydratase [Parafrankia elaeagni]|uniref:MaoC family dehydratase n=1 Tax=Parafrankia elaeagni TaxID=222534 RepID=UPI00037D0A53|nr:MaoC family dehydratase [Parafrankia elaeagni]